MQRSRYFPHSQPLAGQLGIPPHIWTNDRARTETLCRESDPSLAAFREKLYAREKLVKYRRGSVLLYRMDTWHRGTRCFPSVKRRTLQLAYRDKEAEWCVRARARVCLCICLFVSTRLCVCLSVSLCLCRCTSWHRGWARHNYDPDWMFETLQAVATPEQRCLLGWPAPGHRYWTASNLAAVARRYGPLGFDPRPYSTARSKL